MLCDDVCVGLGSEDEINLVNSLFENDGYNPLIRPVKNLSETVTVKFGLAMIQLINVVSCSRQTFYRATLCTPSAYYGTSVKFKQMCQNA